jgi:indolepyruvate ferredoxin oxidoreductase
MSWPLEPTATHEFARGLTEILVVEEKRSIIEDQITGQLYNWPVAERPRVVGEFDENGDPLVSNLSELSPSMVARAIGSRIMQFYDSPNIRQRLEFLDAKEARLTGRPPHMVRTPYFCSGCPHNTSTRIPEGSIGHAGIGCHYMVRWMDRNTEFFTQMGGEGASWIGQAPFTETPHTFQNIGDGTYFHSGLLAIRAAIAAGVNITYRILYNDAVAMTGGQPVDGSLTMEQIVAQVRAEGVERVAVVAEDMERARKQLSAFRDITLHPKHDYDQLLLEMREVPGTSVIVFDQVCASEKRRRRKRGLMPESDTLVFINPEVCEGCGDCSSQSNCLSVIPRKTELGIKRQIDQNACNKDFSCLAGFCPSFVTLTGATLKKPQVSGLSADVEIVLPQPEMPALDRPWNTLVTGIGGTGVLTVSSILAMAAHLEGKGCSTLNQTGLAQKFGAVVSHVKIAARQDQIHAVRIAAGDADLMLGCDLVVSAGTEALARLHPERSRAVVNSYETATADFIHDSDYRFPSAELRAAIVAETGKDSAEFVDATGTARELLGDTIGSNLFLLGYAWQRGMVPLSGEAIGRAIELNGVAIELNQSAFLWGRRAAVNLDAVLNLAGRDPWKPLTDPDGIIEWRYDYLVKYQDQRWAESYLALVEQARAAEPGGEAGEFTLAVAKNLFRLMSYKDEYEVARLFSNGEFRRELEERFDGDYGLHFHLAPPVLAKRDPHTGLPEKRRLPGWTMGLFRVLAKMKGLRGTWLDPFGRTGERRMERALIGEYRGAITELLPRLDGENYARAVEIASLPSRIRGFGHIKQAAVENYQRELAERRRRFREPQLAVVVNG